MVTDPRPISHMAKQRHLDNAPIIEALADFQVVPSRIFNLSQFEEAMSELDFGYYVKNPITQGSFRFQLNAEPLQTETTTQSAHIGLRLHSQDEKYVAQFRFSGLTLSRLPPYESWSSLISETSQFGMSTCAEFHPIA